jgi:hypothetical protein
LAQDKHAPPDGYIRPSEAVTILASKIFGGLGRPEPVKIIKRQLDARVRFGPWRKEAAKCLREAVTKGENSLPLYIWNRSARNAAAGSVVERVPREVAGRLIPIRGGLPDNPYRVSVSFLESLIDDSSLWDAFQAGLLHEERAGVLLLKSEEFETWSDRERARGKWPSQRSSKKPKRGRPSRMNGALRNLILGAVNEGSWTAKQGVKALGRYLEGSGRIVPSHDTLGRLVDHLFLETGNPALRREKRRSCHQGG